MKKRLISTALACALMLGAAVVPQTYQAASFSVTASAASSNGLYTSNSLEERSKQQIIDYFNSHPFYSKTTGSFASDTYAVTPVYSGGSFVQGALSEESLQYGLNSLNVIRYTAGLSEVTLKDEYNDYAQAGALVDAAIGKLTHTPTNTAGIPDDLFNKGYTGTSSSNLGSGYSSITSAMVNGWIEDADSSNIKMVGHRRWVLNPTMQATGFGHVGAYTAMYAFDRTYASAQYTVAWPTANTPIELFNTRSYFANAPVWSLSKSSSFSNSTVVTLTRKSDNNVWTFKTSGSDGDFYINNQYYGQPGCVIFRPTGITKYSDGESFSVNVTDGSYSFSYDVDFFSLPEGTGVIGAKPKTTYSTELIAADQTLASQKVTLKFGSSATVQTNAGSFTVPDIKDGQYTLTAGSDHFVTRTYTVTVKNGELTSDPKIKLDLIGDISGDGKLNASDLLLAKSHIKGVKALSGYQFSCADIDSNGNVNAGDLLRMKSHIKGVKTLW